MAYSAFGEVLDASGRPGGSAPDGFPRYQYAGQWGYETGGFDDDDAHLLSLAGVNPNLPSITLQHLGWRWYQPDIGRFIQRDPIGILGGLNAYAYVLSKPTGCVDPFGLSVADPDWQDILDKLGAAIAGGAAAGAAAGGVTPLTPATGAVAGGIGAGTGVGVYEFGKWLTVCVWDIFNTLDDLEKSKRRNRGQREQNPEVFPPRPLPPIDVPEVPCGHPW